jgi:hypothetical protein
MTTEVRDVAVEIAEFLGIRPSPESLRTTLKGNYGDLPKKRVAREAVFAAPLPPRVKLVLLSLVEAYDGDFGDLAAYASMSSLDVETVTRTLIENRDLIRSSLPRERILRIADVEPSADDPADPYGTEFNLRDAIFRSDCRPLTRLVLLALVECRGEVARPLACYRRLPLAPLSGGAKGRLLAELASWTGIKAADVAEILHDLPDPRSILGETFGFLGENVLRNWIPNRNPDWDPGQDSKNWNPRIDDPLEDYSPDDEMVEGRIA